MKTKGAWETGQYRNVFLEMGYRQEEIDQKIQDTFQTLFYGSKEEAIYHSISNDMAYIEDTGNHDVRTEGMSYGMMMCVQMDRKEEFDKLWKWTKEYMYIKEGENKGYFAWSCKVNGEKNSWGSAPDGEEYFAMALFFAAHRWGNGKGIFNYIKEAKNILHHCIHKGEEGYIGKSMWNHDNYLIKFITDCDFTDPSYHLPHYYELFAMWANEEDREFWKKAAKASREYLKKACHPVTGLCAEYANYDGTPKITKKEEFNGRHDWYYSDAYRTIANIGLDYSWFAKDPWEQENAYKLQKFFCEVGDEEGVYLIDGTKVDEKALHPIAIIATNAQSALAVGGEYAKQCVKKFWCTPLRQGDRRYYDNCLYFFALLALSGNYKIWKPK